MNDALVISDLDPMGSFDVVAPPTARALRTPWWRRGSVVSAMVAFVAFALVVLTRSSAMLEPDDFAYRASIVALGHGQILLSNAQYLSLKASLSGSGQGVLQWHHMASGYWISEKNPGYPFFAVVFYALGLLRLTPLFYGALACVGLFVGMRRWVSERAGALAVWIYCFSGAALTFAWRATMPSFSDASLIAAGIGFLVWVLVAVDAAPRRRAWVGLGAFVALECAVFIRYTNVLELLVAVAAVVFLARSAQLARRALVIWGASVLVLGVLVLGFDQWAYGAATSTGYSSGEISFSLSSLWPNLTGMPAALTTSLPMWLLAAAALVVIAVRRVRVREGVHGTLARTDARIASVLGMGWLSLWALYLCYTWTVNQLGGGPGGHAITVHVIRFYLPALGLIAMLAAWLVDRFVRPAMIAAVVILVVAALVSFSAMASSAGVGAPGAGGPGAPGGPGGPGAGPVGPPAGISATRGVAGAGLGGPGAPPLGAHATPAH